MSTRGMFGFRTGGRQVLIPSRYDSYLSTSQGLGHDVVELLYDSRGRLGDLGRYASEMVVAVGSEVEDGGAEPENDAWDGSMRKFRQGFKAGKAFRNVDLDNFQSSPACEFVYVADLDAMLLEVYNWNRAYYDTVGAGSWPNREHIARVATADESKVKGQILMYAHDMSGLPRTRKSFGRVLSEVVRGFNERVEVFDRLASL